MTKRYDLTRSIQFDDQTGYWTLTMTVNSSSGVSDKPFLVEKAVPGTSDQNTLGTSTEDSKFIRTLLEGEGATQRVATDSTEYSYFTWVQYRTNTVSRKFYTYSNAVESMSASLAVLRSNVGKYNTPTPTPRLVVSNLSAKDLAPQLESIEATKGDVLTLQLVDGPRDTQIITDGQYQEITNSSVVGSPRNLSYRIKLLDSEATYVGLQTVNGSEEYKVTVDMVTTPEERTVNEVIQ